MWTSLISIFGVGAGCNPPAFFGLKPWYQYLDTDAACNIVDFKVFGGGSEISGFLLIALAVVDNLIRIAGFVAIGFIIYGGIMYITSQGSPDQTGKAQGTIQNALIGLVIVLIATGLVTFLGSRIA